MTQGDRDYFYRRAEVELRQAERATCTPAVIAHAELAERYIALSQQTADADRTR